MPVLAGLYNIWINLWITPASIAPIININNRHKLGITYAMAVLLYKGGGTEGYIRFKLFYLRLAKP